MYHTRIEEKVRQKRSPWTHALQSKTIDYLASASEYLLNHLWIDSAQSIAVDVTGRSFCR